MRCSGWSGGLWWGGSASRLLSMVSVFWIGWLFALRISLLRCGVGLRWWGSPCATVFLSWMLNCSRVCLVNMCFTSPCFAGVDNYFCWCCMIDEYLELCCISWHEYGMFSWLCTKVDPCMGWVCTSWFIFVEQIGFIVNYVEKLCRVLWHKCYVGYFIYCGMCRIFMELVIDKFLLVDGSYIVFGNYCDGWGVELLVEVLVEVLWLFGEIE